MAILYGTTGDGTTLPVLVDQFGNLLAKGIEGPIGPPGPPGVGQLPPDPYEGAILGWEDGDLAWIGGSVPLPAGTYGPYTYIDGDERLDIPQDASSLVNGQQLYMSDFYGNEISAELSTDTIADATAIPVPTELTYRFYQPSFTDCRTLSWTSGTNEQTLPPGVAPSFSGNFYCYFYKFSQATFANIREGDSNPINFCFWYSDTGEANSWTWSNNATSSSEGSTAFSTHAAKYWLVFRIDGGSTQQIAPTNGMENNKYAKAETPPGLLLTFPTDNNFDEFEVGDVVQTDVSIIAIDDTVPSITVDGGEWCSGDGTRTDLDTGIDYGACDTYISKVLSGSGSVFLGTDGAILLRNNNKEWVDDFYVTAPEQRIAARKVASNARRRKKK